MENRVALDQEATLASSVYLHTHHEALVPFCLTSIIYFQRCGVMVGAWEVNLVSDICTIMSSFVVKIWCVKLLKINSRKLFTIILQNSAVRFCSQMTLPHISSEILHRTCTCDWAKLHR